MGERKIGLLTAISLVVGNMVGTGIFSSLGFQIGSVPSVTILLFLWICGGIVALCGGFSYIQLAKLFPNSGGEYHYISMVYPRLIGYFAGFVSIFAGFAAPVALSAMAFSVYFSTLVPEMDTKLTAIALITTVTLFHCFSLKLGSRFHLLSTLIKIIVLVIFIAFGMSTRIDANPISLEYADLQLITTKGFATSLVYVSFAYSGWNACIYIFNEIKNPQKNIGRSILIGTAIVTILYVLLNYVFLKNVPMGQLKDVVEIGAVSAKVIFGSSGGKIIAALISLLLVSSISAMVWVGPRVINKMLEKEGKNASSLPAKIPLKAIAIQFVITVSILLTDTFQQIFIYTSALLCISSCLAVGILLMKYKVMKLTHLIAPVLFTIINIYTIIVLLS